VVAPNMKRDAFFIGFIARYLDGVEAAHSSRFRNPDAERGHLTFRCMR